MENLSTGIVMTPDQLLELWQGHRRVTRRVIEAFPEEEFFEFTIGEMRPFSAMVIEIMSMQMPGVYGIATRDWETATHMFAEINKTNFETKEDILTIWDKATRDIDTYWKQIPAERFQETEKAFGQWEAQCYWLIYYFIDNEIHHRGQGTVYLRALDIEPPAFYDRS